MRYLKQTFASVRRFLDEESATAATEYGVMLALIVVVSIGTIYAVGTKFQQVYEQINTQVSATSGS